MPVNSPPFGPGNLPPGTSAQPVSPYFGLASNIGTYTNSKAHGAPKAWGFGALSEVPMASFISLGAGLTGSTQSAAIMLANACKIPKIGVAYKTIDLFTGTETFNIVVESAGSYNAANLSPNNPTTGTITTNTTANVNGAGTGYGATYTAGAAQTTPPGDTSGWTGYPNEFAAVSNCLFANDVPFSAATFTAPGAGTTGGNQIIPTTQWDAVYAPGTILSLRPVTTASTGSVTGLIVVLFIQPVDILPANDRAIPTICW